MKTEKRQFGDFGEKIACSFLIKNGYKIIETNFDCKYGEIDVICSKFFVDKNREELFFVEVKTRSINDYINYPENAVDYFKKIKLDRTAQIYLNKKRIKYIFYSFSCLAIIIDKKNNKARIKFFERI